MRIVEINMLHRGSTGEIMLGIANCIREHGGNVWTFSPNNYIRGSKEGKPAIEGHSYFGFRFENAIHWRIAQLTGFQGYGSIIGTFQLLNRISKIHPDVIHLHNLHNRSINLPMLFNYIKRNNIKTVWTLHDCWPLTGQCPYFTMIKCEKWKTGCYDCPQISIYPKTLVDRSKYMWKRKRRWFTSIDKLTIVTPSKWLRDIVKQSFLNARPIRVINNGVDLSVFRHYDDNPREEFLSISKQNGRFSTKIVIAVSSGWSIRKGLDSLRNVSMRLTHEYQLVVVGINAEMRETLPKDVICVSNTKDRAELARMYSAADVFINPTMEEAFGLVNIEALACGVPVVTFRSGGSPECVNSHSGIVVDAGSVEQMLSAIDEICHDRRNYVGSFITEQAKLFDEKERYKEYLELYESL